MTVPLGIPPWTKFEDQIPTIPASTVIPGLDLSEYSSYHNGVVYGKATIASNVARAILWRSNQGASTKSVDPLTGKSLTSLSFWDWVKMGELSLKLYGQVRSLMRAIKSGGVTIDAWKLMPKLAVISEDDPASPVLYLGIAPASEGAYAIAKDLTDWSDPRYRLSSKADFSNIKGLVPSLAVKPSFFGALAHYMKNDLTGQVVSARLSRNMHELMVSMSMLRMGLAGGPPDPAKRFTVVRAKEAVDALQREDQSWKELAGELSRGVAITGNTAAANAWKASLNQALNGLAKMQEMYLQDIVARKSADTWAARALGAEMDNMTLPLETDDYMAMIDTIEELVEQGASAKGVPEDGKELLAQVRTEAADTGVNRLIRDEMRAIRQLYGMKARRELVDKMAPSIAMGLKNLDEGADRLNQLELQLRRLSEGQKAASYVLKPSDVKKLLNEPFIVTW